MQIFEVLADPVRRRILELLAPGEMASGEVVEVIGAEFGITQAAEWPLRYFVRDDPYVSATPTSFPRTAYLL